MPELSVVLVVSRDEDIIHERFVVQVGKRKKKRRLDRNADSYTARLSPDKNPSEVAGRGYSALSPPSLEK